MWSPEASEALHENCVTSQSIEDTEEVTRSALWNREPHTAAKHELLRKYLGAWFPILGGTRGRVVFLDGFAGPGVYQGGEPGSPIIALSALLDHSYFSRLSKCEFHFVFNELDPVRFDLLRSTLLEDERRRGGWPVNVKVTAANESFGSVARELASLGRQLAPTFAFIDPFGYRDLEMSVLADLLAAEHCELFCYFDYNSANRFATAGNVDDRFEALFGTTDFKNAPAAGSAERGRFLISLFERQLVAVAKFTYVQSFAMRNRSGNLGNYLVFATRSLKGLDVMKQAMWKIDPSGEYAFSDKLAGQQVLFAESPDTSPLKRALMQTFGGQSVRIEHLCEWVVAKTPYHSGHVKRATLAGMESEGLLSAANRTRARTYPDGTIVTFAQHAGKTVKSNTRTR